MTAEEILALFERSVRASEAGDYEAFVDTVDPRIDFVTVPDWPDGGTFRGPDAVWAFIAEFMAVFGTGTFEFSDPEAAGDSVLVVDMRRLTSGDRSGATVEWSYSVAVYVRSGRLIRVHYFDTRDEALAAARDG